MANNRMYLVFMPTKDAVYLGKRMGWGWYGTPVEVNKHIQKLYDIAEVTDADQDNFRIIFEDQDGDIEREINVLNLNQPVENCFVCKVMERFKSYIKC